MNKICGSEQQVEEFQKEIKNGLFVINNANIQLKQSLDELGKSFEEEERLQIESIITKIIQLITEYMDDFGTLYSKLEAYKAILRQGSEQSSFFPFFDSSQEMEHITNKGVVEKEKEFKEGLEEIDKKILEYAEQLTIRGITEKNLRETILENMQIEMQAELHRNINEGKVEPINQPNLDLLIAQYVGMIFRSDN